MIRRFFTFCLLALLACSGVTAFAQSRPFHVLAFYSTNVEQDHVDFAMQAIPFFQAMAKRDHFDFKATSNWNDMNPDTLKQYQVVLWLDDAPSTARPARRFPKLHGAWWSMAGLSYRRLDGQPRHLALVC